MSLNEPQFNDEIVLLDIITGKPTNRASKILRVVAEDREMGMFEVVDRYNKTLIVTATENPRSWLEVDL